MEKEHLIFDLDGTLIDSRPEIWATYQKVFSELPPAPGVNVEKLDMGQTLMTILRGIYHNESTVLKARQLFLNLYDHSDFEVTPLYEGVINTLADLTKKGYTLHIATNKRYVPAKRILEKKGVLRYFKSVAANEMVSGVLRTKEEMLYEICQNNTISLAYMIGDTSVDMEAATRSGIRAIAVLYGYELPDRLMAYQPYYNIHKISDLSNIFQ